MPDSRVVVPAISSTLCWIFAAVLFRQWLSRRRPYQIVWAIGLVWYALAAGADAVGNLAGWSSALYRTWYFCGAICAAAWLGLGEVYLFRTSAFGELVAVSVFAGAIPAMIRGGALLATQASAGADSGAAQLAITVGLIAIASAGVLALVGWERPYLLGHVALGMLVAASAAALIQVIAAPLDLAQMLDPATGIPHGAGFPETVRLLTPPLNIAGALAIFFGAGYSAWQVFRRRGSAERLLSNALIAAGALAISQASALNRFGTTDVFYLGELLGVVLIFAGFLASTEIISRRFLVPRAAHT